MTPSYEPSLRKLAALKAQGAPWHAMVRPFLLAGAEAEQGAVSLHGRYGLEQVQAYHDRLLATVGTDVATFGRMARTLEHLERICITEGIEIHDLLSDDFEAVETAARLVFVAHDAGVRALKDLKAGRIDKAALAAQLGEQPATPAAARPMPHAHWANFEEGLEFDRLHYMCEVGETIMEADWDRLLRLARAVGHAVADSHFEAAGNPDGFTAGAVEIYRRAFEDYESTRYFEDIAASERLLADIGGEGRNRNFAGRVCESVRYAFGEGRQARIDSEPSPVPTKGF